MSPIALLAFSAISLVQALDEESQPVDWESVSIEPLVDHLSANGHGSVELGGEWVPHPAAESKRRLDCGQVFSDVVWKRLLLETGTIRYSEKWPISRPWAVSIDTPNWLDFVVVRLEPTHPEWRAAENTAFAPATCGLGAQSLESARSSKS